MAETIDIEEAKLRGAPFMQWIVDHDLGEEKVRQVDIDGNRITALVYASNEAGQVIVDQVFEVEEWVSEVLEVPLGTIAHETMKPRLEVVVRELKYPAPTAEDAIGESARAGRSASQGEGPATDPR